MRRLTSLTHILFGNDYPFIPEQGINANVDGFRNAKGLSAAEHEAIARRNAYELFPRLMQR
ncbi:amidohydrolase family protein [Glaciimonas sp. PCH181]|uniref:amidohydrolase family protein n=1 Tax=Glaciimonas sp. PCH181 TaxID=2133943 RepID=UPI00191C0B8F